MSNKLSLSAVLEGLTKTKDPLEALSKVDSLAVLSDKCLIIIADFSGSMNDTLSGNVTKIQALKDALTGNLVSKLAGWTYGIIGFGVMSSSDPFSQVKWIVYPTTNIEKIKLINKYEAIGSTPILGGLREAWKWSTDYANKARFVLVSDGQPTDASNSTILSECQMHRTLPIDTIGVGNNQSGYDEAFLKEVSRITGGIFSRVNSIGSLTNSLIELSPEKRLMLGTTK